MYPDVYRLPTFASGHSATRRPQVRARPLGLEARRALNIAVALAGLILLLPVMLVIAVLVKLSSHGPVLYQQTRVGVDRRAWFDPDANGRRTRDLGGKPFTIYKFRTMQHMPASDAEVWARPDDPRVTRVGKVLRKYRQDELPQLVNVLRGEMNIVGPRPEQPSIFSELREKIDGYDRRQRVLPGITGWAQINQHYDRNIDDVRVKLSLDLEYIERSSALEDLRIMLKTVPVVVMQQGAW